MSSQIWALQFSCGIWGIHAYLLVNPNSNKGTGKLTTNEFPQLGTPMHSTTQEVDSISSATTKNNKKRSQISVSAQNLERVVGNIDNLGKVQPNGELILFGFPALLGCLHVKQIANIPNTIFLQLHHVPRVSFLINSKVLGLLARYE